MTLEDLQAARERHRMINDWTRQGWVESASKEALSLMHVLPQLLDQADAYLTLRAGVERLAKQLTSAGYEHQCVDAASYEKGYGYGFQHAAAKLSALLREPTNGK